MSQPQTRPNRNITNEERTNRPERIPVGVKRDVLNVSNKDPAYNYRLMVPTEKRPDRIRQAQEGGYEIVDSQTTIGQKTVDSGTNVGATATKNMGLGDEGYLMRIRKEFYEEDQKAKEQEVRRSEESIKREVNKSGRYGTIS